MCERVLRASHGMNASDFLSLLRHVGGARAEALLDGGQPVVFDGRRLGREHAR